MTTETVKPAAQFGLGPTERLSIRMIVSSDNTLNGYVFMDEAHAHAWLSQPFVKADEVRLERVVVGPSRRCRTCGGTGSVQTVKPLGAVGLEEFLGNG